MSIKPANPRAFPQPCTDDGYTANVGEGMELRDYFAAKALCEIIKMHHEIVDISMTETAKVAYKYADAMLKVREL